MDRAQDELLGVIGTALDAWMLYPGWVRGETPNTVVSLAAVVLAALLATSAGVAARPPLAAGLGPQDGLLVMAGICLALTVLTAIAAPALRRL